MRVTPIVAFEAGMPLIGLTLGSSLARIIGDVLDARNKIVSLGVLDGPFQRVVGDLEGPGGVAGRELSKGQPHVARGQVTQWLGADDLQDWIQ